MEIGGILGYTPKPDFVSRNRRDPKRNPGVQGISLGLAFGIPLGIFLFDRVPIGIGIGVVLAIAFTAAFTWLRNRFGL